jgi:hypothetical protein
MNHNGMYFLVWRKLSFAKKALEIELVGSALSPWLCVSNWVKSVEGCNQFTAAWEQTQECRESRPSHLRPEQQRTDRYFALSPGAHLTDWIASTAVVAVAPQISMLPAPSTNIYTLLFDGAQQAGGISIGAFLSPLLLPWSNFPFD